VARGGLEHLLYTPRGLILDFVGPLCFLVSCFASEWHEHYIAVPNRQGVQAPGQVVGQPCVSAISSKGRQREVKASCGAQGYGPPGVSTEFQGMLRCAVAHARLLRSFQSLLDPSREPSNSQESIFGTQNALADCFKGNSPFLHLPALRCSSYLIMVSFVGIGYRHRS
jgi:hypothetical protein